MPVFGFGGCREAEFSGKILRSHKRRSHRSYYNFTEITITTPPLARILDRLIGRGINPCSEAYNIARPGRHKTKNNELAL